MEEVKPCAVCGASARIACWGSDLCSACHVIWWNDPRHQVEAIDCAISIWGGPVLPETPSYRNGYSAEATKRTEAWVLEQRRARGLK